MSSSRARSRGRCPEADVAALMTSQTVGELLQTRSDFRRRAVGELDPDPGERSGLINDIPNPFEGDPPAADRYLRGLRPADDEVDLPAPGPGPGSWDQYVSYVTSRAFRFMRQAAIDAMGRLVVVGNGDGLTDSQRARRLRGCIREGEPFAAINPIDGITGYLAVDDDDLWASVAIVVLNRGHVAIGVATGSKVAVGNHDDAFVRRLGGGRVRISDMQQMPPLRGSVVAPFTKSGSDLLSPLLPGPHETGEAGNPMLLNGVVLGGIEAGYQPNCRPWDAASVYIAAAAGLVVGRASTGKLFTHPSQVQTLLVNALLNGHEVPGLITARHELAARTLLRHLRGSGSA